MNRQIGVADSKYLVLDDTLPHGHVTQRMRIANFAIKMAHSHLIAFIHYSGTDQDRSINFGNKCEYMDFYTNLKLQVY